MNEWTSNNEFDLLKECVVIFLVSLNNKFRCLSRMNSKSWGLFLVIIIIIIIIIII